MIVQAPTTPSLFPTNATSIKAFNAIGPNSPYEIEFSSIEQQAPLLFLDPSDTESCPGCCGAFSPFSSGGLSPEISSLVANRTVVLKTTDLLLCEPSSINFNVGYEKMHICLGRAGALAVIFVDESVEPGWTSNIVGSFVSRSDQRAARNSLVPFVAVGSETGRKLVEAIQAVQNSSTSTTPASHDHVHVVFTYDENAFLHAYHTFYELPFKFISFFTFFLILHRCHSLGLRRDTSTGLPLLSSTKTLVVLMAVPVAVAIMIMISLNGMSYLDEGSRGSVFFLAGTILPCLNLASSVLVARFWSSRRAPTAKGASGDGSGDGSSAAAAAAADPAKSQPVLTLLIVFSGVASDLVLSSYDLVIHQTSNTKLFVKLVSVVLAVGYIITTLYFFYSGIQVLRSHDSSDKPFKTMASYLLAVGGFTLVVITSFVMVGADVHLASVDAFFVSSYLYCKKEGGREVAEGERWRERGVLRDGWISTTTTTCLFFRCLVLSLPFHGSSVLTLNTFLFLIQL